MQVNAWATTRQAANDLIRQADDTLRTALLASPLGAFIARYDSTLSLYGAQQDFSLWY